VYRVILQNTFSELKNLLSKDAERLVQRVRAGVAYFTAVSNSGLLFLHVAGSDFPLSQFHFQPRMWNKITLCVFVSFDL